MKCVCVTTWIVFMQFSVFTSSESLPYKFPEWNPFVTWCQAKQPALNLNYSIIHNSVGNTLNILNCGNYSGAVIANEIVEKSKSVVGPQEIYFYQKKVMDEFTYLKGIAKEFGEDTVVLDYGADVSGGPLSYLVSKFGVKAVGYNVYQFYDSNKLELFDFPHQNISMVLGKIGDSLPFKYGSFQIVLSANVMEHVHDYQNYLQNAIHVLKHKGLLYVVWSPSFYGYLGHHVHPDMLENWWKDFDCGNDSVIPDWRSFLGPFDHLLKSPYQLKHELKKGLLGTCDRLIKHIVHYMHESSDLNRMLHEDVITYLQKREDIQVLLIEYTSFEVDDQTQKELQEKLWPREFNVRGLKILAQKL